MAAHIAAARAQIVTHFLRPGLQAYVNVLHCTAKMTKKQRPAQLKNARLVSVAHFKKRKLERIPNTEQPRINNNELNTNDTGDTGDTGADTDEEGTWFWNQSANELESDSECDG